MATQQISVASGTTSATIAVNSNQSIFLCPQVLGGTVTLEYSAGQSGPFYQWTPGASTAGASFRLPSGSTGYVRATAASQAAILAISDMVPVCSGSTLVSLNGPFASGSTTAETIIGSFRIPPYALPQNFNLRIFAAMDFTNNANAKTMQMRINGVAGTLLFQSAALASLLNINVTANASGLGDGVSWMGYGSAGAAGTGTSSTAYTTLSRDYITQETEIVVACTKATGTDAFVLRQLTASVHY